MGEYTTIPVKRETKEILDKIKELEGKDYDALIRSLILPVETIQIDLSKEVPPATGYQWFENRKKVPFDGMITQITLHFPSGCNGLVEVRIGVDHKDGGLKWICPIEGFIALDNTTQTYMISYPVRKGDYICAEIYNYDDTYSHKVGIIITIRSAPVIRRI